MDPLKAHMAEIELAQEQEVRSPGEQFFLSQCADIPGRYCIIGEDFRVVKIHGEPCWNLTSWEARQLLGFLQHPSD